MVISSLFPFADWQMEVANGDTTLGYDQWVAQQTETLALPDDDALPLRTYGVRLWASFRGECDQEIKATSFEEAVAKARLLDHSDYNYSIDDSVEGDQTAMVYGPDDDDADSDPWDGDGVEIDSRKSGEPFSWDACQLVKDLAELHGIKNDTFHMDKVAELITRAKALCTKDA